MIPGFAPFFLRCLSTSSVSYRRPVTGLCLLLFVFATIISTFPSVVRAAGEPPEKPLRPQSLIDIEKTLEAEKKNSEYLARQVEQARTDLQTTRGKLVTLGENVRENETGIREADEKITVLMAEESDIQDRLEHDRGALSDLLLALERLRRTPPESMILRPDTPIDMARGSLILRSVLPDIQKRADSLRADLNRLASIRIDLEQNRALSASRNETLQKNYDKMSALLKERESLYGQTVQAQKDQSQTIKQISQRAKTIADLLSRIEQEEKERRKQEEIRRLARKTPHPDKTDSPLPDVGSARIPVSGIVRTHYGEKNDLGAQSEGLLIDGRNGGVVVAPMGGIVRYAGPFRHFGNIIIIEHQKGFHSLLAGLGKIDTVVGRSVSAGEPLGFLGTSSAQGGKPSLYYELRLDGQPVDPAKKLADLG